MERITLTVEEAAQLLGIGRTSAYRAVQNGSLPAIRIGKRLLVSKEVLRKLLEDTQRTGGPDDS